MNTRNSNVFLNLSVHDPQGKNLPLNFLPAMTCITEVYFVITFLTAV